MLFDSTGVLGVRRESCFSPGKVNADAAILETVVAELSPAKKISVVSAENLAGIRCRPAWVLSMAQSPGALEILRSWENSGTRIFNSVSSVCGCYRKALIARLQVADLPIPPSSVLPLKDVPSGLTFGPSGGYWLKRGDVHAIQDDDVVHISSAGGLPRAMDHFQRHGIEEVLVQEHVAGDVVKFYGVGEGAYFCAFSSTSGSDLTGLTELSQLARKAAAAVGLEIYGGDAVLTPEGRAVLIDLNDWPSFSRCCLPAAECIAGYVSRISMGGVDELSGTL